MHFYITKLYIFHTHTHTQQYWSEILILADCVYVSKCVISIEQVCTMHLFTHSHVYMNVLSSSSSSSSFVCLFVFVRFYFSFQENENIQTDLLYGILYVALSRSVCCEPVFSRSLHSFLSTYHSVKHFISSSPLALEIFSSLLVLNKVFIYCCNKFSCNFLSFLIRCYENHYCFIIWFDFSRAFVCVFVFHFYRNNSCCVLRFVVL